MEDSATVRWLFFPRRQGCNPGDVGLVVRGLQEFAMVGDANPRISKPPEQNSRLLIGRFLGAGGAIGGLCSCLFGSHDDDASRGARAATNQTGQIGCQFRLKAKNKSIACRADDRASADRRRRNPRQADPRGRATRAVGTQQIDSNGRCLVEQMYVQKKRAAAEPERIRRTGED